jgi:hypothetical protein
MAESLRASRAGQPAGWLTNSRPRTAICFAAKSQTRCCTLHVVQVVSPSKPCSRTRSAQLVADASGQLLK